MESITVKLKDGYPWRSTPRDRKKQSSPQEDSHIDQCSGKACVFSLEFSTGKAAWKAQWSSLSVIVTAQHSLSKRGFSFSFSSHSIWIEKALKLGPLTKFTLR